MATILLLNLLITLPSLSVSTSMTMPVSKQATNEIRTDQVAMYMPSCTQAWGAPFLSVMSKAYMRVVTNKIASMGARDNVAFAPSTAANNLQSSMRIPVISDIVNITVIRP